LNGRNDDNWVELKVKTAARKLAKRSKAAPKARAPRRGAAKAPAARSAAPGFVTLAWEAAVEFTQERRRELLGVLYLIAGVAVALALVPLKDDLLGPAGGLVFRFCFGALGIGCVAVPAALMTLGLNGLGQQELRAPGVKVAGWSLVLVALCCLTEWFLPLKIASGPAKDLYAGGLLGRLLGGAMVLYLSTAGTWILCLTLLAVAVYLLGQENLVKIWALRAYERARLGMLFGGFKLPGRAQTEEDEDGDDEAEAGAKSARRRRPAKAEAQEAGGAGFVEASAPEPASIRGVDSGTDSLGDDADASASGDIRLISAKDREDIAARFLMQRQKIKVSEGGPRVNTAASTESLALNATTAPQGASELKDYVLPSPGLLKPASESVSAPKDYEEISAQLERVLASFGVAAKVVEVCPGPTVTRYEIELAPGVKMSRVVSLSDDIALGAKAGVVRIEGPIPGKGTLGIEIPNSHPVPVMMRELVDTEEFRNSGHKLVFAVGKDIGGSMIFSNLAEMPHLMVAGATGSGKSVCLNAIITSVLFRAAPDEVKFLMVDPKRVELTPYDGIPHLMRPVVSNPKEAAGALRLLVEEMEDRYKMLAQAGMRKIDDYNEWVAARAQEKERSPEMSEEELAAVPKEKDPHHRLPYIVVVVDELADLMMVSANEVESSICRLAQMARGVGIHLVIATQRPSVDVITGVIKANLPSRIAFQVSSKIDSRTILDGSGAEALLGKGDMLYSPYNVNKPVRVQGCFLSGSEVAKVVAHVKNQAEPVYDPRFTALSNLPALESALEEGAGFDDVDDELYEQALRVVIAAGQGSTSVLQRRLKLGFGRASRLLDRMEAEGIIGPAEHNKPRKLLINPSDYADGPPESAPAL
jgi:S-DNA-T family DNA segregation ATPase FtsK/SpoIIIE